MPGPAPDFERLFAAGTRHTLSRGDVATVRLRQDTSLWLPSGRVVAGEPFGFDDSDGGFVQQVPPGQYPLVLVIAMFAKRSYLPAHEMIAAARLVIRDEPVVSWEMAVCEGQDVSELGDDEFFGYPVDGGTGGFVDAANIAPLREDHDDGYYDRLMTARNVTESDDTAPGTLTDDEGRPLLVAFSSGDGDGDYPTWVGRTADGEVACYLTDFFVLTDDEDGEDKGDDEPPSADGAGYALSEVAQGHEMRAGQALRQQALTSPSGSCTLVHQNDGNLVLYNNEGRGAVWSAGTQGHGTARCVLQADGDLVIYDDQARVVWSTDTAGNPGSVLAVRDDGLELRAPDGTVLWSVRTALGTPATSPRPAGATVARPLSPAQHLTSGHTLSRRLVEKSPVKPAIPADGADA
ncbi:DUF4241 domain-containing protein [Saccharopolyspora pogona]|uniref:DUF4241 domain-containing protein n=1 Tax=Saccharopolyspora pogona TaxID=333966 RepID=UPI001689B265|nr:DUF4241 domain-containing protein [Saccharopolyspora pogona]